MALTKEQLMAPRYKVIAGYPASHLYFDIGDILEWDGQFYRRKENISMTKDTVESYPHLFRKLEWWEERKDIEYPEYVIWDYKKGVDNSTMKGHVQKVIRFDQEGFRVETTGTITASNCWLPATEEEYNQYIQKKP